MTEILTFVIAGFSTGSVYALAAMGLVLTNKTSGVFNFAHGAQGALGAFIMWELWQQRGWPWPVAATSALVLAGVCTGLVIERLAAGLFDTPVTHRVVAAIGLLVSLQGLMVLRYGGAVIKMPYFLPTSTVELLGVNVRYEQIILCLLAAGSAIGLALFFSRSRDGLAMQAVVDDPALLSLQGINPQAVRRNAWMVGSCFAAASGMLLGPTLGLDALLLTLLVVQAYGAAAIGRFNSLPLTYLGGLVVGVGQELLKYVVGRGFLADLSPQLLRPLPQNLPFIILFVVLIVTPRAKLVERGGRIVRREGSPVPMSAGAWRTLLVVGSVVAIALPYIDSTRIPLFTGAVVFALLFASLHLLMRTSDLVSLCHMALAGIGAATSAHLAAAGWPFPLALLAAGMVAVPVGAVIAIPAIRMSGLFLAIATFGYGLLVENLLFPTSLFFGPTLARTAPRPSFAESDRAYYYLALTITVLGILALAVVRRSRLGRLLRAHADSKIAVAAHGASTNTIRVWVFCISAFLAGIAGALIAPITQSASGGTFSFGISLIIVPALFICGRNPVVAPVVAAALYVVLPSYVREPNVTAWTQVVFGVVAALVASGVPAVMRRRLLESKRSKERLEAPVLHRRLSPQVST